jgi:hypothetical protein
MSRMAKDRGESKTGSSAERRAAASQMLQGPQIQARQGMQAVQEGDFVRAFADALHDILLHDRSRAITAR